MWASVHVLTVVSKRAGTKKSDQSTSAGIPQRMLDLEMLAQVLFALLLASTLAMVTQAQTCSNVYETFTTDNPECRPEVGGGFEADLRDLYCDKTCGPMYQTYTFSVCAASLSRTRLWDYYTSHCTVNADGRPCYSFYNGSETDMSLANNDVLQLCNPSILSGTCSDDCRNRLTAIGDHYGSCINSVFNSSYFHSFNYELLPLFSYALWTSCGVPIPMQIIVTTTTAQVVPTTPMATTTDDVPATTDREEIVTVTVMTAEPDDETTTAGVGGGGMTTESPIGMRPTSSARSQLDLQVTKFAILFTMCFMAISAVFLLI